MKVARLPVNEQERLKSLNEFYLLDSLPEADFDNFTQLASDIFGGNIVTGLIAGIGVNSRQIYQLSSCMIFLLVKAQRTKCKL